MERARHILLVEDDADTRRSLAAVLEGEGYVVHASENGKNALQSLDTIPRPDLILLDLMMPDMNGLELSAALRRDKHLSRIPIVVLSAVSPTTVAADHFAGCLAKPFRVEALRETVRRCMPRT
jgi:CheY-like chemotaxis protein